MTAKSFVSTTGFTSGGREGPVDLAAGPFEDMVTGAVEPVPLPCPILCMTKIVAGTTAHTQRATVIASVLRPDLLVLEGESITTSSVMLPQWGHGAL